MYTHSEIHSEFARQRRVAVNRQCRGQRRNTQRQAPGASLDDIGPLIEAARSGDQRSWELLVTRFTPRLRRVVRSYGLSDADVEDVVQATWTAALTYVDRIRVPEAFGGWLLVTARHASLRALERNRREIVVEGERLPDQVTDWTPEYSVLEAEQRKAFDAAIERLPDRQSMVVRALLRYSGTSYAELALKLGIPLGSLGPTRERALARLRRDDQLVAAR
jgi:RNA polymerase sigma factor (sigma-70 family)